MTPVHLWLRRWKKHQQEKALFRSASKHHEFLKEVHPAPVFSSSPFAGSASGHPEIISDHHSELLDPLEKGHLQGLSGRSISVGHLQPPDARTTAPSRRASVVASTTAPSIRTSIAEPALPTPSPYKAKIGTPLDSWSRYPSHNRFERCGSAGHPDAIVAQDFAVHFNPEEIHAGDENEVESPRSKRTENSSGGQSKSSLPKSRSTTFSGILRYYSNLFSSSSFRGQNRRTSVTTGGRLEYPELEMLPPSVPADIPSHRHSHTEHLKEHVIQDAEWLKDYVKEEEDKIGGYVKKEEDKFEGFMRMEEDKIKHCIKDEKGKLVYHHHHQQHRSSDHDTSRKSSPFRAGSIFVSERHHSQGSMKRRDTTIAPSDVVEGASMQSEDDGGLQLDGTATSRADKIPSTPSRAEIWSEAYRECIGRSMSTDAKGSDETTMPLSGKDDRARSMPPPALKPAKPRLPEQPKSLDPKTSIRRFPSVTVIDDRKGHFRSVSLISVKTSKSQGFERSSTHELLEVIQAREREERENLSALSAPPVREKQLRLCE